MTDKKQLHNRLGDEQVRTILQKFRGKEITGVEASRLLGLGRTRFYEVVQEYKKSDTEFTIAYKRTQANRTVSSGAQERIIKELQKQQLQIEDQTIPLYRYNYSYAKDVLEQRDGIYVSVSTISRLAHAKGYVKKKRKKKEHTQTIITPCIGELIQHDSSHHLFAPYSGKKWCLVSSIDDCSRLLLHAQFHEQESSYAHIQAVEQMCVTYGIPHSIYSDNHRIFRYVKNRDDKSIWTTYTKFTDDVQTQWKAVLTDLQIKAIYATSPQAKGKIERPYGWIQDRLVRRCMDQEVHTIQEGQRILDEERHKYNTLLVHSQIQEIPQYRFNRFHKEGKTFFRPFILPKPYTSPKDIFALRVIRQTDGYRRISLFGHTIQLKNVETYVPIVVRIIPRTDTKSLELRCFYHNNLIGLEYISSG